ncbi:hypothetical protein [Streptomyces sp. H34-S4]|uniref:hypothetical protein n=1 Tax=Streptomyces sp. H34-S4 TaxID=2996463 RepID=UPI002270C437|nr:hypothetical protein [Streptomyces sp. H34-S4]MCY0938393.1 hypothetical protein [Streptomyces sp. H34-S4]
MFELEYEVIFPDGLDEFDWSEIEDKGWIDDVRISWSGNSFAVSFFDEIRLPQAVAIDVERLGYFSARNIVVVRRVARDEINRTVSIMADRGFADLLSFFN